MGMAYNTVYGDTTIIVTEDTIAAINDEICWHVDRPLPGEDRAVAALREALMETDDLKITTDAEGRRVICLDGCGYWESAGYGFADTLNHLLLLAEPGAYREDWDAVGGQDLPERTYVISREGIKSLHEVTAELTWPLVIPSVETLTPKP